MKFKAYVINMEKSQERREFMVNQLTDQKIDFEIFKAIDGKTHDFTKNYSEELSVRHNGKSLSLSELGCALSHRLALEKALNEDLDYALVLEDDVELPPFFSKILAQELSKRVSGKTSWEYLSFNYPTVGIKYIRLWLFLLFDMFSKNRSIKQYFMIPLYFVKFFGISFFSLFEGSRDFLYTKIFTYGKPGRFYRPIYLAGCYLITKKGINKLLSISEKIIYPADRIQNEAQAKKRLKLFHFVPLVVKQRRDKFESTMNINKKYVFSRYD